MRPLTTEEYRQLDSLLRRVGSALTYEGYPAERLADLIGAVALTRDVNCGQTNSMPEDDVRAPF